RPQGIENGALGCGQALDVLIAAQPADVGVPVYDAGCRTRRIDQNAIEAAFVPPAVRLRGIADDQLRLEVEALKARADPAQALAVDIQGRQLDVATLENMGGLAAGCRA